MNKKRGEEKDKVSLAITNPKLLEYLRWLNRNTAVYGNRETEAAWKLLQDQLEYLIESGKIDTLGNHAKQTEESNRFTEPKAGEKTGAS